MKKLFIFLSTIFLAVTTMAAWAQENPKLSYQAVVRDNQNRLLTNSTVNVEINILKPDNAVQYTETFNSVPTNQNGLMSLLIGNKSSWDNVDWFKAKINVKISLPGGMGMVESTSDVSAVPLAISALYADSVNLGAVPQSDWDETNPAKCTFIKNKPNIPDTIKNQLADGNSVINHIVDTIADNHIQWATDTLISNRELTDTMNVARGALADTASVLRGIISTLNTNLQSNIDSTSQQVRSALVDTASDIRADMNAADAALQNNIDTTSSQIRAAMTQNVTNLQNNIDSTSQQVRSALVDTASDIRADMNAADAALQNNIDTTSSQIRAAMTQNVTNLQNNIDSTSQQVRSALVDTASDIRADMNAADAALQNNIDTTSSQIRSDFNTALSAYGIKTCADVMACDGIVTMQGNISANATKIHNDSTAIMQHVSDTATAIRALITGASGDVGKLNQKVDSLNKNLFDTLHIKYVTNTVLADTIKDVRDSISALRDSMTTNYVSNADLCEKVMDCADIQKMRDSIQTNKNAIVANAANIATNTANITTNTTDIATLKEHTTKDALCDSVSSCVATAMDNRGYLTKDSTVITTMQTSIGQNATDIESLQSALVGYAKLADANTYTGNNDFTGGTTRVASGFTFGTTTSETCNNIAVNACDLLVVFDSIQKQFAAMQQQIDGLRDSLQRLRGAVVPAFSSMTFDRTENSLTATADFDDGGATITEYNFCISTSEDMSDAICQTSTESTYTFEDLNPGTQYYMTVAATNLKGTITSDTIGEQTVHSAPELSEATANAISNTEIEVTGTLISMGGTTPTTITVYAYTNSDYSDAEPIRGTDSTITSAPKEFQLNVSGLTKDTQYYLAVIADNGEKKDTVKTSAITKSVTVVVTSDPEADTIRTGSNVDVTVIYSATVIGEDIPAVDAYLWKVNDTDSTSTSNELTVHFTESGTYKVVCIVNGVSDTAVTVVVATDTITFIPNGGVGSMDKQIVERGVETPLAANGFTHDGWTFKGWNNDYTHTVTYEDTANITTDGNIELYAVWATSCTGTASANETGTDGNISSVKDVCDNEYAVIAIGEQCWMKENLRTTKYADNSNILADNMFAPNNVDSNVAVYGRLYNWAAVMNGSNSSTTNPSDVQGVCPNGWHVPSAAEWDILINYVNGQSQYKCSGEDRSIAKAMSAPTGWIYNAGKCFAANLEGNNATGFSAVAAGFHNSNDDMYFGRSANFVTSTESNADNVSYRYVYESKIFENTYTKAAHLSVRCVRNEEHMVTFKTHEDNLIESKAINGTIEFPGIGDSVKREGYNFNGWNTKIDGSGTHFNVGDEITPTSDTTFYTEWFQCGSETSRVYDSENNGYLTAKIGERCYLAENLRTQTVETGNAYPAAESQDSVAKYGMLYDYEAAQGICPPGWKLPALEELSETTIENFAIKMAGLYTSDGYSNFFGNSAYFWTSDDNSGLTDAAYYKAFFKFSSAEPNSGSMIKTNAASVRCVFSSTNE